MWMALLEKALAKAFGTYERLNTASPEEALLWLTGKPAYTSVSPTNAESQFIEIEKAINQGHVVTAKAFETGIESLGIHPGNVYTVLDAIPC